VNWTQQDGSISLSNLTQQLVASRSLAQTQQIIPAIVDATTWQALHLSLHKPFVLDNAAGSLSYLPIAEVQQIPTLTATEGANNGVLVDYQTYALVYNQVIKQLPPLPASVWLRTRDDTTSLAALRAVLTKGTLRLSPLYDRRQLLKQLQQDPLLLVLVGLLVLGAVVPLVFAIAGSGVAFWLSARNYLTNIVVLRALGSTPRQVSRMLLWEQGIVYSTALVLGGLFGCLLTFFALPALIFSSLPPNGIASTGSTSLLYALQNVPPVRITLPLSLGISLFGLGVLIVATFSIMVGVVMRPDMSQRLRLNED
jgi:ABC-type antimicrobial peptide transport system permease subunit